jgi:hypothetical protein
VGVFSSGNAYFYVNGALQNSGVIAGNLSLNGGGNIVSAYVGCIYPNGYQFAGYVDDVRIYTSALNSTQVSLLYNNPPLIGAVVGSNYLTGLNGSSYTPITLPNINGLINCASLSNTGQYMSVLTQGTSNNVYYSTNYGASFTALTVGSSPMTGCAMSADGTYFTVSNATQVYTLNLNGSAYTVAIGTSAGQANQASNAIAIGNQAGQTNQTANSIVLNASGSALNAYTQGFYVAPIQPAISSTSLTFPLVGYGSDNQIVQSATSFSNTQQTVYGEWIQYQLATASPITSYTLQGRAQLPQRYPISWIVAGSNDGTNWTLLDTQTGTSGWGTYTLTQVTGPYTYYRIVFTQIVTVGIINLSGFILNNGAPLFGPSANYTVAASGLYNVLQLNGTTVCTTTFSWPNTTSPNSLGINADGPSGAAYQPGWIPTTDGYTKGNVYFLGFGITAFGPAYEYNASGIAFQGTSTTINTTTMGNMNMAGTLINSGSVGIGTTNPRAQLQINGGWGTADTVVPAIPNAYASFGQNWNVVSGLPVTTWNGCAVSATGQYMTLCVYGTPSVSGNNIYYSSNYGASWTLATGYPANLGYAAVQMSGSGQYQIVGVNVTGSYYFYTSSNYGATWTQGASSAGNWFHSALSYNGQYQFITAGYVSGGLGQGYIWMSSNYGATFTQVTTAAGAQFWGGVCCSWSGQYVSAAVNGTTNGGAIYYSSNYGATWTASSSSGGFASIACSSSGQYQVAPIYSGGIYYSNNYGVSWALSNAPSLNWQTMACTASGQYQMATVYGGYIWYSTNYGVTWSQSSSVSANWPFISMSQNGLYTLATNANSTTVYLSTLTSTSLVTSGAVGIGTTTPQASLHIVSPAAQGGNTSMVTTHMMTRPVTAGVQNSMSGGFAIGASTSASNTYGRMDIMVCGLATPSNGYGITPDVSVATFLGSGNVGIGTTAPANKLEVSKVIRIFAAQDANPTLVFNVNPAAFSDAYITGEDNANYGHNIGFYTSVNSASAVRRMTILGSGNVGIGTANPGQLLTVYGSTPAILIKSNGMGASGTTSSLLLSNSAYQMGAITSIENANGYGGVWGAEMTFSTYYNTQMYERMRISATGNVGIGTANPGYTLTIVGSATSASATTALSLDTNASVTTAGGQIGVLNFANNGTIGASIQCVLDTTGTNNNGALVFNTRTDYVTYVERMRITRTGSVKIGPTISPLGGNPGLVVQTSTAGEEALQAFSDHAQYQYLLRLCNTGPINGSGSIYFAGFVNYANPTTTTVGSIVYNGTSTVYNTASDARMKKNISYDFDGMAIINQLKPATFSMISDTNNTTLHGFIAQDVVPIYPQYVTTTLEGTYQMDYKQFMGIAVKAIQELSKTVTSSASHIQELAEQITQTTTSSSERIQELVAANATLESTVATQAQQIATMLARLSAAGIA